MLTNKEIKKQISLGNITIKNMREHSLNKPNSCDIRIGNCLYEYDYSIIDSKVASSYKDEVLFDKPFNLRKVYIPEEGKILEPHKVYLTRTVEEIETHGYIPMMSGKVSLSLLGLSTEINSGYKEDGYKGPMLVSIVATKPTVIYPDMPIGNLSFFPSLNITTDTRVIGKQIICGAYSYGMLSGTEIKKRMEGLNPDIIITPTEKAVFNPNSVNLTLNEEIGMYTDSYLDVKYPGTLKKENIGEDGIILYPDEIYLGKTNEWTETQNLIPMMSGRSSLGRNGLHVHCSAGMGSIGYKGYWHMGIRPSKPIKVVKDLKCCQIYYYTVDGDITNTYDGIMQNLPKEEYGSQMHKILKMVPDKKNLYEEDNH